MTGFKIKTKIGFDNRIFLTKEEYDTYLKRKPVRYIHKEKKDLCEMCGKPETKTNTLQNAHMIPFGRGITYLGLTPNYVDGDKNIVTTHKIICNKSAELDLIESCKRLILNGVKEIPDYLPKEVHEVWNKI